MEAGRRQHNVRYARNVQPRRADGVNRNVRCRRRKKQVVVEVGGADGGGGVEMEC